MNTYYKILNEIASTFNMDQWDEQVDLFVDAIKEQLKSFIHNTKYDYIFILEGYFPQFDFYKEKCYVNGEKVILDEYGIVKNKWKDQETVEVTIEDLDQLGESCECMFHWCSSLVSVPLFDTSRVTNMKEMFQLGRSLKTVPLFDISKVENMHDMFYNCPSLSEKTIQEWSSVYNFKTHTKK